MRSSILVYLCVLVLLFSNQIPPKKRKKHKNKKVETPKIHKSHYDLEYRFTQL